MTTQEALGHESSVPSFPNEHFPLAPAAVRHAYGEYWQLLPGQRDLAKHQQALSQTNQLVADFCDSYLTPQTYDATMLGPIADALLTPHGSTAAHALNTYCQTSLDTPEDKLSVLGLLSDRPIIQTFWHEQIAELYADDPETLTMLYSTPDDAPAPEQLWQHPLQGIKTTEMLRLHTEHGVNIKSFLIAAAETVQYLWQHAEDADVKTETAKHVHMAESLYAPFCEIIGFDGLSMALRDISHRIRMQRTGQTQPLWLAETIIGNMGGPATVDERVRRLTDATLGEHEHKQVLTHMASHGIVIGEGVTTQDSLRFVWREKTIGALANKLARLKAGQIPMDIIGSTAIAQDPRQIGTTLQRIRHRIDNDPRAQAVPSPSRTTHLHVKGTPEYIATIGDAMGLTTSQLCRLANVVPTGPNGYHVAKATYTFQQHGEPWPAHVEQQLVTEVDRERARKGATAHALRSPLGRNDRATPEEIEAIAEIHRQKERLGQNNLTPFSRVRALQLERLLAYS